MTRLRSITTVRPQTDDYVEMWCGGVAIYASTSGELDFAVAALSKAIELTLKKNLILAKPLLAAISSKPLGGTIPSRVFSAILGRLLRFNDVVCIPCLTKNSKIFRVYLHSSRQLEFQQLLDKTIDLIKHRRTIDVSQVEKLCFGERQWGTWFWSQQILQNLAFRGLAVQISSNAYAWPSKVDDAVHLRNG